MNKINDFYLSVFTLVIFLPTSSAYSAVGSEQAVEPVAYSHLLNWFLGLIVVLGLFFSCVWVMKRIGALPINSKQNLKVIAGLSLGMREKLVLVQVGEKQLVLGVTPGRINNLLVLEGKDQLFQKDEEKQAEGEFSDKLKQLMTGALNE